MEKKEFRLLRADEIEARIGNMPKSGGAVILLYKDARCDMAILDETFGIFGWQRHHSRDNANCIVSVWDDEKKQWIEKEDTGTESNTEASKGLASDSFKRACFNLGIGRELYTAPFIYFKQEDIKDKYEKFYVTDIQYDGRKIKSVKIMVDSTKKEFEFKHKVIKAKATKSVETDDRTAVLSQEAQEFRQATENMKNYPKDNEEAKKLCGKRIADDIVKLCEEKHIDIPVYLGKLGKKSFEELTIAQATSIINSLSK